MSGERTELVQGTLDMLILKALTWGPAHGFGIARWIEQVTRDDLWIEEGALYPALHRMHRKRWLAAEWGRTENNRRAKYYRLTRKGRQALNNRIARWEASVVAVRRILAAKSA